MTDYKLKWGTSSNITISLASKASSATVGQESTAIDNSTDRYIDVMVQLKIKLQTGTPANDETIYVFAYGSEDGTTYTDNCTGSNASITLRQPPLVKPIGVIPCPDSGGVTYESQPMYIAQAFGGKMPREWGIVVLNYTGVTLSATEGDHTKKYSGAYYSDT